MIHPTLWDVAMASYDAFISYSHAKDKPIAAALQATVQTLGKPWYKLRALRVFRDDASLAAAPGLWAAIEQALSQARFAILLASPEAARSPWVAKEIAYWLEHKSIDTLLIGVTDGILSWNSAAGDFDWSDATPLPALLKGRFPQEPRWIDLTAFRGAGRDDSRLAELAADFAAAVRGVPKQDLLSEEVRQQRRALRHAWSAAAAMLVLALGVAWQWREAVAQRDRAEQTLAAATASANDLVSKVAVRIRQTVDIPVDLTREILGLARDLQERLARHNDNAELRRSEAMALRELAQTLLMQGDVAPALRAARQSLEIMESLIARSPRDPQLRYQFSLSHNRIGEVLSREGQYEAALGAFQQSLAIRRELADADPAQQRGLALSYERVGDAQARLERRDDALKSYRESLAVRERLADGEPDNAEAQSDLAFGYERVGAMAESDDSAVGYYDKSLVIRRKLAADEPRNAAWLRNLAATHDLVAASLRAAGRAEQALEAYQGALAIRERLAAGDPGNPQWQAALVVSLVNLAESGDSPRQRYDRALRIVTELEAKDKLAPHQQDWRGAIEDRLANLETQSRAPPSR
jgi:tetratricopeptide (TPR) repeat protein